MAHGGDREPGAGPPGIGAPRLPAKPAEGRGVEDKSTHLDEPVVGALGVQSVRERRTADQRVLELTSVGLKSQSARTPRPARGAVGADLHAEEHSKSPMRTTLITGATGFLGAEIARQLVARAAPRPHPHVHQVAGDVTLPRYDGSALERHRDAT